MVSAELAKAKALAEVVHQKLQRGKECVPDALNFVASGAFVPVQLIEASFGVRHNNINPCPETLRILLEHTGNPNDKDSVSQGPLIHRACWEGHVDVVKVLLEFRADIEAMEQKMMTPPLNTALAGGNAKVCLELLNRNADVQWKHQDGATALHVTCAWIASSHNAQLRTPPLGEEPRAVIAMMLHNGVDPTSPEGMTRSAGRGKGMTPLESFQREIQNSPWRRDPNVGPKFDQTAAAVNRLLEQSETAVKKKNEGNQLFKVSKYSEAIRLYAEARKIWLAADIRGHHVAVLFSNEAACHKKNKEWVECQKSCNEGLTHYCTEKIRRKLEDSLKESVDEAAAEARGEVKPTPAPVPRKPASKLEGGFLSEEFAPEREFYPTGSVQGGTGKSPGPFICGFQDALHAGFVDGCDGDKDKARKEEQALDKQLCKEGYLDPELVTTSDKLDLINGPNVAELARERAMLEEIKNEREDAKAHARTQLEVAIKSADAETLRHALDNAKRAMVPNDDSVRLAAQKALDAVSIFYDAMESPEQS